MKLLIDECLSPDLAALAWDAGWHCAHVARIGLRSAQDWQLVQYAIDNDWVIVTLGALTRRFVTALKDDERYSLTDEHEIERKLKGVAWWRNALCHGAWTDYDTKSGYATLRYWPRKQWREQGDRPISRDDLARIRRAAVEVTIMVINAVTTRGIQFPGSDSPGRTMLPDQETLRDQEA